ncbi:TIGR03899 family protein [Shewanella eurypsychrophilus]|uniref:TIGR03899 family protein n=1 Tax=Shewanella eurypsychrophilus TaxID=2593656 RepID=A0ABX6VCH2_9GAMM|nr:MULTISPECIES: TIGR03899 family protein [Shewanella]QFU24314.1 TIGR03899 family protein [Shewanella sp. YLB-09]QPG59514.1 TIGR03899 family protein [Shewanella eurypsychrophilus]
MAEITKISEARSAQPDVSARKKALLLGRQLGLSSEEGYRPTNASVAERAEHRNRKLMSQYQTNLETIYAISLSHTPSDVTGTDLDPDWAHQFFQMAEQIHNRKMQELWGRILANEITSPGNFSLRTLTTLKQLTHKEAQLLEKALGMAVKVNNETRLKLIIGYRYTGGIGQIFRKSAPINIGLSNFGLPYSNILTLVDAGILHKSEFETGLLNSKTPINFTLFNTQMKLTPKSGHLLFNYYRLTPIGDELTQLIQPKADNDYTNAMRSLFVKDFKIE